jgi:WhiB family redox-sensing transcriptional regulator
VRVSPAIAPPSDVELCLAAVPGVWVEGAACRDADPELFFAGSGSAYTEARAICAGCPVVAECRDYADRIEAAPRAYEMFGMFAGESPSERVRRRRSVSPTVSPRADAEGSAGVHERH